MDNKGTPVVIENGSYMCKAGFSGDDEPKASFRSVVSRPSWDTNYLSDFNQSKAKVGSSYSGGSSTYPIQYGIVHNWDAMTEIWHHCFRNVLKINPSNHPCLLSEPPRNPPQKRQRTTEIMFETFEVPAFYLANQAVLSIYTSGKTTGLVLGCGYNCTHSVPIFQGYAIPHAIQRNDISGQALTKYMKKLLSRYIMSEGEAEQIKQQHCYVASDYEAQIKNFKVQNLKQKEYNIYARQNLKIGQEIFQCPQALFKPMLFKIYQPAGIHQQTYQSIRKCDVDLRKDIYSNIVLCGGSTFIPGMVERFTKEITALAPSETKVKVYAPKERENSVWIGGSILASLSTFKQRWITKQQYYEHGSEIVHRKCF